MHIIIKDSPSSNRGYSQEEALMRRISLGTATTKDVDVALKAGGELEKAVNKRYDEYRKEKKYLDNMHGEGVFDYKDKNGNLVKNVADLDPETQGMASEMDKAELSSWHDTNVRNTSQPRTSDDGPVVFPWARI